MAYPSVTFANLLENATRAELEQFSSLLQGYLSQQHDEDGAHTDVTAVSVDVSGDGSFGADLSADGSIVADADGSPVTLATDSVLGTYARFEGSSSDWRIAARGSRTLAIQDVLETGDASMLDIIRTGSSTYDVRPHSSAITLSLGTDASGQRWSSVNAVTVTSSSAITASGLFHLKSRLAPSQITSNQNDYAISTASRVFLTSDAARDITGIVAGSDGQLLWIVNSGAFNITLKFGSGSSSAANRIAAANSADVVIRPQFGSALLQYDTTSALWYVLGA